jgi:Domain of unknown function (DUF4386)
MSSSSIQAYARLGGVLIVLSFLAGGFGEAFAPSQIIVSGNATATAHHIIASNTLFRAGFAAYTVEAVCDVALAVVLYLLIRPVSYGLALFFVLFRIMATAVFAFGEVLYFAPAIILSSDPYLKSFTPDQLNTLALVSLNTYGIAAALSQLFYAIALILLGYLLYRSEYLPRTLGVLSVIGGVGFAISTYAAILAPAYDLPILRLPTILTALVTAAWLLSKGVAVPKWEARARAAQQTEAT